MTLRARRRAEYRRPRRGTAKALTTATVQNAIYVVFFDQKGLMAGLGLQGSKISRMDR